MAVGQQYKFYIIICRCNIHVVEIYNRDSGELTLAYASATTVTPQPGKVVTITLPCGIPGVVIGVTEDLTHGSGLGTRQETYQSRGYHPSTDRFFL